MINLLIHNAPADHQPFCQKSAESWRVLSQEDYVSEVPTRKFRPQQRHECITHHGWWQGMWMDSARFLKCKIQRHPWFTLRNHCCDKSLVMINLLIHNAPADHQPFCQKSAESWRVLSQEDYVSEVPTRKFRPQQRHECITHHPRLRSLLCNCYGDCFD